MTDKLFLTTLNKEKSKQTPIWMMRQAGRYLEEYRAIRALQTDFISLCLNPKQASTITLQPITRFKLDAAIIFSDILLIPWAMDLNVRFKPNVGPLLDPVERPGMIKTNCLYKLTEKLAPVGKALELTNLSLPEYCTHRFCRSTVDTDYIYR